MLSKRNLIPLSPLIRFFLAALLPALMLACNEVKEKDPVPVPEKMDVRVQKDIRQLLDFSNDNKGRLNDTIALLQDSLMTSLYAGREYKSLWCSNEAWTAAADSLFNFIQNAKSCGLFPLDYHSKALQGHRLQLQDSLTRSDAMFWSRGDLMMTDAFLQLVHDLKAGRLPSDSISSRNDSIWTASYYDSLLQVALEPGRINGLLNDLQPRIPLYVGLKSALQRFVDSLSPFRRYTHVEYPYTDSAAFYRQLQLRLFEEDILVSPRDTMRKEDWTHAIRLYQQRTGMKATGKISKDMVDRLNFSNWEKFKQAALNLDRYKLLPDTMPTQYLWINIPGFSLHLFDHDTIVFSSKVVVGKSTTPTPLLQSAITNMVTYPQWTIPTSIIVKEIIPGMRKDTAYLEKHGFVLVNGDGQEVPPRSVNWWKYSKGLPYKVIQGSGDDNALGILKFNFNNKYSVYLHDTNQRYLFERTVRALSHGCIRVQQWKKLAFYLLDQDSLSATGTFSTADSVRAWLNRKEKHWVPVRNRMPLYVRYFTCDENKGNIKFYNDIYGKDSLLLNRYYADKPVQ